MNLLNEKVRHVTFGYGTIFECVGNKIVIKFDKDSRISTFLYPDSFGKFLFLENKDVEGEIENEIKVKNDFVRKEKRSSELLKIQNPSKITSALFDSAEEFSLKYINEINSEVQYLKENGGKRYDLFDGELVESNRNKFIYIFETTTEFNFPDNTQIKIWLSENIVTTGFVISCEDYSITIVLTDNLGLKIDTAKFSAEPWHLLEELNNRIDDYDFKNNKIVNELICNGFKSIDNNSNIKQGQDAALAMGESQPITFIWGPPGTGKTETLSRIAEKHIKLGHRILMVSYSNV